VLCHGGIQKRKIPTMVILAQQLLGILANQIKTKEYFLLLEFSKHYGDVKLKLTIWTSLFL